VDGSVKITDDMTTDDQQIPVFIEISITDWCVTFLTEREVTNTFILSPF